MPSKIPTDNNRLSIKFPEIAKQWYISKNGDLTPENVPYGSHKEVWWKCEKGHEWQCKINSRRNRGCPYCSNKKLSKENCLFSVEKSLYKDWDYVKNKDISLDKISFRASMKVWWKCEKGHSYLARIRAKTIEKTGCPYCSNIIFDESNIENSFGCVHNKFLKYWDYDKNTISPYKISPVSGKRVWWKCDNGHSYLTKINNKVSHNSGCPFCSHNPRVNKENCLQSKNKELCKEWNVLKNINLTAKDVTNHSNKKVWWKCKNSHEWIDSVSHRTSGRGCPYCNKIILKNGGVCDSLLEAYKYLEYKEAGIDFRHNKEYHKKFGKHRYDFYLILENKYIEVTSFDSKNMKNGKYFKYLRRIVKKRKFVEDILKAKFEFIQSRPTPEQIDKVRKNSL